MRKKQPIAPISSTVVDGGARLGALHLVFGKYALWYESMTFEWMRRLDSSYNGGHWEFYHLSNEGFYMSLGAGPHRTITAPNHFICDLSSDAAGITASLYALNELANRTANDMIIKKYYQLLDFAREHSEHAEIFAAID